MTKNEIANGRKVVYNGSVQKLPKPKSPRPSELGEKGRVIGEKKGTDNSVGSNDSATNVLSEDGKPGTACRCDREIAKTIDLEMVSPQGVNVKVLGMPAKECQECGTTWRDLRSGILIELTLKTIRSRVPVSIRYVDIERNIDLITKDTDFEGFFHKVIK